jgi:hypothetical protein
LNPIRELQSGVPLKLCGKRSYMLHKKTHPFSIHATTIDFWQMLPYSTKILAKKE